MTTELRLNIYNNLISYESRLIGSQEVLWCLQYDQSIQNKTELYRHLAKTVSREEANKKVKEAMMPAFSVAVQFKTLGKQTTHITRVTGLCICDIDHVPPERIPELRTKIAADPHTFLYYVTISGEGFRILYRYTTSEGEVYEPPENAVAYRAAYKKGNSYYARLCGVDYDGQCSNLTRLSGMAHDPEARLNENAQPFLITDDEAAEANLTADTESGKPRKEYPSGTHQAEVEAAWEVIEPMLSKRNITYGRGTHHQYVMHASHLFNRFGADKASVLEWAAQNWSDYNAKERDGIINWVWQHRQSEYGTWRLNKAGRPREVSMIALPEVIKWLRDHHYEVVYNLITDQTIFREDDSEFAEMDESALCTIRRKMADDTGKRILKNDVRDMIMSDYAQRIHPVRDFITALPKWDGKDRVSQLAGYLHASAIQSDQTQASAQELLQWALHKWLVAATAGWLSEESCNQTILTLIGPQGIYKTSFFRYLLPPPLRTYFWENSHNSFVSKDDQIALTENCLVDIEEIDMFKDRDNAELKSLSTRIKLKIRRPYDKFPVTRHRLASLCATGNQEHFLTDETGDRRWLCFLVSQIDDPRQWDLDYHQLYAQLRDEYYDGFQYWFDKQEERRIERQNEYFRIISDEEQLITSRFRKPRTGDIGIKYLKPAAIAQMLSYGRSPLSSRKVGSVMRKLGFKWSHSNSGSVYQVFELTPVESQASFAEEISPQQPDSQNNNTEQLLPF